MTIALATLRGQLSYQAVSLGLIALIASAALVGAHRQTAAPIAAAEQRDLEDSLAQVLPPGFADNALLADSMRIDDKGIARTVYRARKGGAVAGAVFRDAARGYAGDVAILMAVAADGRVLGVRVIKHAETPGLGDKIEPAKSDWILSFNGRALAGPGAARWAVKKDGGDFDQFAGATITPRAVVKAVKQGLEFFAAHRDAILARENAK